MTLFDEIYVGVFTMLRKELPSFLTYHSPEHTAYVIEKSTFISVQENISHEETMLIRVAALFHDTGFVRQYMDHEEAGCEIATEFLNKYSIHKDDIQKICGMIMATKIPQMPQTLSEKIVADADLEYLGTDLFNPVSQLLFKELHYLNPSMELADFQKIQIDFLKNHSYHPDFCKKNREPQKQKHLQRLLEGR